MKKIESFFRIVRIILFGLLVLAGIILLLMVFASQGKSTLNYINIFSEIFVVYLHVGSFTAFGILSYIILIALGVIGILSTLKNKKIILFATICLVFSFLMIDDQTMFYFNGKPRFDVYMLVDCISIAVLAVAALNWVLQFIQNRVVNVTSSASKVSKDKKSAMDKDLETRE